MSFYSLRQTIYKILTPIAIVICFLLLWAYIKKDNLDTYITDYTLNTFDQKYQKIASTPTKANWQAFQDLGEISRHHRYANLKTELWLAIMASSLPKTMQNDEFESFFEWSKKQRRNIALQESYYDFSKISPAPSNEKFIQELKERFPNEYSITERRFMSAPELKLRAYIMSYERAQISTQIKLVH